jgi:hypothetical protein
MSKESRLIVDDKGNVSSDFYGYEGDSCRLEEERLRKLLAQFGLEMSHITLASKPAINGHRLSYIKRVKT